MGVPQILASAGPLVGARVIYLCLIPLLARGGDRDGIWLEKKLSLLLFSSTPPSPRRRWKLDKNRGRDNPNAHTQAQCPALFFPCPPRA